MSNTLKPPFTAESARAKVQAAEDLWNLRDADRVVMAYTEDSIWRNRNEFLHGREAIRAFLKRKWAKELDYTLKKTLWCHSDNRIAVTFEYEWHDDSGQWYRSYGNELWEFNQEGLMTHRIASINDLPIPPAERIIALDHASAANGSWQEFLEHFNYCYWSKRLVAIPLLPILAYIGQAFFTGTALKMAGAAGLPLLVIWLAIKIDQIPALQKKIPKFLNRK